MQSLTTLLRTALLLLVTGLAACQPLDSLRGEPGAAAEERAERLAQRGDQAGAARAFEEAAAAAPLPRANTLWLRAAGAWTAASQADAAERALGRLVPPLPAAEAREQARISAEIALARNEPRRALALLDQAPAGQDPALLATRARAQFALGQVPAAVSTLGSRERLLPPGQPRLENQRQILDALSTAARRGADLRAPAGSDPTVAGWMELGRINADATTMAAGAGSRLQEWRRRYPAHPANDGIWSELVGRYTVGLEPASRVALLLPLTGRGGEAGRMVRDGFLAAYYEQPAGTRPTVALYDVGTADAGSAYLTAIADGASLVIGPLTRGDVSEVAAMADGRATTIALNFLPDGSRAPSRFYQFALSPEDEARQAARRALADGRSAGVALGPANEWGQRVLNAFAEEFAALGGRLVGRRAYAPGTTDYKVILTELLGIRPTAAGSAGPRPDIGFIFVAGQPVDGRLIRTQLRFNYAGSLPVYSTSDVYEPGGRGNADLDGVVLPEMPWVLDAGGPAAILREQADQLWPRRAPSRDRLFAFGYDAYAIGAELVRRRAPFATPVPGLTGRLELGADGRIHRQLDFARVSGGRLELLPGGP
jgi:outer membrane PBP1 activator LpoA protein